MKVRSDKTLRLRSGDEDGHELVVRYENRGDPYRQGVGIELEFREYDRAAYVFLEEHEARELRDLLSRMFPAPTSPEALPSTKGLAAASPTIADPVKEGGRNGLR